jgi:hypothetical protein
MYEFILNRIKKYDKKWCKLMNYDNVYISAFKYPLTAMIEPYDIGAYKKYPEYNHVYDKLWVAKTQNMKCGRIELITEESDITYPIFIKPRWGHKTASSRNCYKIKTYEEIKKYQKLQNMMWSEFVDGTEEMTDFILIQGKIVYSITYKYSDAQHGYIDEWKYISPNNNCPDNIIQWVETHMKNFSGPVNIQYRKDKIIEVSLRLARGGAYIQATQNKALIENINKAVDIKVWDFSNEENIDFKSFYSFKSYTTSPLLYILPYNITKNILKSFNCDDFFEYYFEPSGNDGMVFLQFINKDFKKGMACKHFFENIVSLINYIFIFTFVACVIFIYLGIHKKYFFIIFTILCVLFTTQFLNPIDIHVKLNKAKKQRL